MRVVALVAAVLVLTGCTLFTGPTSSQVARADTLGEEIAALDGVADAGASYSVGFDVGNDLRVSVEPELGATAEQIIDLVSRVNALVATAGFNGSVRSVEFELGEDSVLSYFALHNEAFKVDEQVTHYLRWWSDPRVASLDDSSLFWVVVEPGSSVRDVYTEIAAGPPELTTDRTLRVEDPDGYMVNADREQFAPERFDAAEEIAVLPGLTECSFSVTQPGEGPTAYLTSCHGAATMGDAINEILAGYGQLADTEVQLFDDGWVTTNAVP